MFMDRLLAEVQGLATLFSSMEMIRRAEPTEPLTLWRSPRSMLRIVSVCARIAELGESIAKAGHRECEKSVLDQITHETRLVLYNISAGISQPA